MAEEAVEDEIKVPEDTLPETVPEGYTADEWEGMTQNERDSILIDKEKVNLADEEAELGAKPEEEVTEEQLAEIAEEGKLEEIVSPAKAEEKKAEAVIVADENIPSDEELLSFRPTVDPTQFKPPAGEVISPEVKAAIAEVRTKFNDGDLTADERDEQMSVLNRQITLDTWEAREDARRTFEREQEQVSAEDRFFASRPWYSPKDAEGNLILSVARARRGALNGALKNDVSVDPKNAGKSFISLLVLSDKAVKEALGYTPAPAKKADEPAKKKTAAELAAEKPPAKVPDEVKNLGEMPNSDIDSTDNWMKLGDRLKGEKYEKWLEGLSPARREQYRTAVNR